MKFKNYIAESSLNRIRKHTIEHDCGIITASRKTIISNNNKIKVTNNQNKKRNKILLAELLKKYNVISLRGVYIENYDTSDAIEVGENIFFVVDINDKGQLEKDLFRLGVKWNQDSILFMPKNNGGVLIGAEKSIISEYDVADNMFSQWPLSIISSENWE